MELINQSANAVLPHSCNFKEGSQKKKKKAISTKRAQMLWLCLLLSGIKFSGPSASPRTPQFLYFEPK